VTPAQNSHAAVVMGHDGVLWQCVRCDGCGALVDALMFAEHVRIHEDTSDMVTALKSVARHLALADSSLRTLEQAVVDITRHLVPGTQPAVRPEGWLVAPSI
jgi:hypothetical protein